MHINSIYYQVQLLLLLLPIPPPHHHHLMDKYLGLKLRLIFKDESSAEGTVISINDTAQKLSLSDGKNKLFNNRLEM